MRPLYLFLILSIILLSSHAQKPIIDTSVFDKWPSIIPGAIITNDGAFVSYDIRDMPINSRTTVIMSTSARWKREFIGADGINFTSDCKHAIFKTAGDSLCLLTLGKDGRIFIPDVTIYRLLVFNGEECLSYLTNSPVRQLVMLDLVSGRPEHFPGVSNFLVSPDNKYLVMQTEVEKDSATTYAVEWLNIKDSKSAIIWEGQNVPENYIFSRNSDRLAFKTYKKTDENSLISIWYYQIGMNKATLLTSDQNSGIDSNLSISRAPIQFSKDGNRIFIKLIETTIPQARSDAVKVDIWSYKDAKLQSLQLDEQGQKIFVAAISIPDRRVIRLQYEDEKIIEEDISNDNFWLISSLKGDPQEEWWNPLARSTIYLVSTIDGNRKQLNEKLSNNQFWNFAFPSSPDGKWLVYFDQGQKAYFSHNLQTGVNQNITGHIPFNLTEQNGSGGSQTIASKGLLLPSTIRVGIADWSEQDSTVLIYDQYDIWKVDPAAIRAPVNLTNGYGRRHKIKFRLPEEVCKSGNLYLSNHILFYRGKLLLRAFDTKSKFSGFYQTTPDGKAAPELLTMGPWNYATRLYKAYNANSWIVSRMSDVEPENYYTTSDFQSFTTLSFLQPQKEYNWLTTELIHWKTLDDSPSEGILYKPEDFNPAKKYPLLIYYYEKLSDGLYSFKEPDVTVAGINIPYFVSRGYLVFTPDIHYKMGSPGQSIVNSVLSAAGYLSKLPFVDSKKIGIDGHSFGGYETNYLVSHAHLFAAAAEMSGPTDFISEYGGIRIGSIRGRGQSGQEGYEISQCRIGATLWQRPDLFIKNSPIFKADQVTTPLLMAHSLGDNNVPFEQSLEFFTELRRLRKKVWLLQYDNGSHIVGHPKDAMDYTIRLTQFFDYYLKGAPPPLWMTEGISARLKGIQSGYALDLSGTTP